MNSRIARKQMGIAIGDRWINAAGLIQGPALYSGVLFWVWPKSCRRKAPIIPIIGAFPMSAVTPKADMCSALADVRFVPIAYRP